MKNVKRLWEEKIEIVALRAMFSLSMLEHCTQCIVQSIHEHSMYSMISTDLPNTVIFYSKDAASVSMECDKMQMSSVAEPMSQGAISFLCARSRNAMQLRLRWRWLRELNMGKGECWKMWSNLYCGGHEISRVFHEIFILFRKRKISQNLVKIKEKFLVTCKHLKGQSYQILWYVFGVIR
jgi:hypothetical protein